MCVIIIAFVFLFIFLITCSGLMFQLSSSASTNTGFRLFLITHKAVEIIENVGIIISLPLFKFRDLIAISSAAVPLLTEIAYFFLCNFP